MNPPVGIAFDAMFSPIVQQHILSHFDPNWLQRLDLNQMTTLIDEVLPFEACLYHQMLPLAVEGNHLHLGMVTLTDQSAYDYAHQIVSYLGYTLMPHPIAPEAVQATLTAYLNAVGQQAATRQRKTFYRRYRQARVQGDRNHNDQPTLLLEPADFPSEPSAPSPALLQPVASLLAPTPSESAPSLFQPLPDLELDSDDCCPGFSAVLETQSAEDMLSALLKQALASGIGRLYFEAHSSYGRVLWSQDGVLQSAIDPVPLPLFQQLIDGLKQLAQLPLKPIQQSQSLEIEQLYQQTRVLLRFRFMPGEAGEEATLQVLRGVALKFHQQQQLQRLERDAMRMAQQLQAKLNEISDRATTDPEWVHAKLEMLPNLSRLLKGLESQIASLVSPAAH
jgi:type II secretory ATPase GspE/PulE/Tfp pilus assembly ATPase PilB-like protein